MLNDISLKSLPAASPKDSSAVESKPCPTEYALAEPPFRMDGFEPPCAVVPKPTSVPPSVVFSA